MDAELKTKWVAALRSGRYLQGKGRLYSDNKYCCLGVLCDLEGLELISHNDEGLQYGYLHYVYGKSRDCEYLPVEFADKVLIPGEVQRKLAEMNDSEKSFSEIATYIEENL